jgi:hypothetical protein
MTLGEIIQELKKHNPSLIVPKGWAKGRSFRGYYEDLAFEPKDNATIGEMLKDAEDALGKTFDGYKGGEYEMGEFTDCWICEYGTSNGAQKIGKILLDYMIGAAASSPQAPDPEGEKRWQCGNCHASVLNDALPPFACPMCHACDWFLAAPGASPGLERIAQVAREIQDEWTNGVSVTVEEAAKVVLSRSLEGRGGEHE